LVIQFITETIITTLVSLAVAGIFFHFLLKPFFESLAVAKDFDIDLNESTSLYFYFLLFSLLVGLLAGIIPALYLSAIKPSHVLKNFHTGKISPKLTFRKILLGTQFTFALVFVITLVNFSRQLNYVMNADYGFNKDNIINIELQGNDYSTAKKAFALYNGALQVSGISHSLGTFRDRQVDVRINEGDEQSRAMDYTIDTGYINNLGLHLLAGKNYTSDLPADRELFIIVNEAFLRTFHLGNASEAIGKSVILNNDDKVTIRAVLKDFHFKPFTYEILPLVFRYNPSDIAQLNIKVSGTNQAATIAGLAKIWKSVDKEHVFSYRYFSDEIKDTYAQYADVAKLMGIVSITSVAIAFLGLVALVFFLMQQKIKEISIRKVLGATIVQLYSVLSKGFLHLLIITIVISVPISIFLNNLLMQQFSYRVNQYISYFEGTAAVLLIAFMAIGMQVWKAAVANPVKSLRTE
jgi:putative ABC transport system permease protein